MFVIVNVKNDDEFEMLKTNNKDEAIKYAKELNYINKRDENFTHTELRIYPDGYEEMDWFDFDTIDIEEA